MSGRKKMSTIEFIEKARKKYGDKYDYSKTDLDARDDNGKVIITCPIHGDFKQNPSRHLCDRGCPECGKERMSTSQRNDCETFIGKAKGLYGTKYDYSKVEYKNNKSKVCIICPKHGEFFMTPNAHLRGQGCPKCGRELAKKKTLKDKDYFLKRANEIHNDKYTYENFKYINYHTPSYVTCPIHGDFRVAPTNHISNKSGCPKCGTPVSRWEQEIFDFITSLGIECEQSNRTVLNGKEIDIYIPKYSLGIECDGIRWHNELYREKNYHLNKSTICEENGIRLIHIFEDEWFLKKEIWQSMLLNMFQMTPNKIYARSCLVKMVKPSEKTEFLIKNHIQGNSQSSINYGLYYNDELVSLMTFGKPRLNLGGKREKGYFELVRFCNKLNTNVLGGASKLFKAFLKDFLPKEVVSYSDKRWSTGDLYRILGFSHVHDSRPNYFYVIDGHRENRFKFRKSELIKEGHDENKTEHEIMFGMGVYRIYDCGTMVWKWKHGE
jgi:endogenous inhibitor of DNA gyrase (YacG/DUF329 family)